MHGLSLKAFMFRVQALQGLGVFRVLGLGLGSKLKVFGVEDLNMRAFRVY